MRDILVLLFWCWCALSVVILVRRVLKTGSFKSRPRQDADTTPTESFEQRLLRGPESPATVDHESGDDTAAAPVEPQVVMTRVATLAEALEGIALPTGLTPVIGDRVDPRNMLFSSTGHRPEVIGQALGDEIERLGFAIQPVDEETIRASKNGTEIEARIHPDLERARLRVGSPLATLPESSILVQMRLR